MGSRIISNTCCFNPFYLDFLPKSFNEYPVVAGGFHNISRIYQVSCLLGYYLLCSSDNRAKTSRCLLTQPYDIRQ